VPQSKPNLLRSVWNWWIQTRTQRGDLSTFALLTSEIYGFFRDSMPARRRQRYGDVGYDWDFRVDTTSATVGWRDRLLGTFHSPYQATDPTLFHEMLARLDTDFRAYTFIDLGSGKGRTLMMASRYPFRRIIGVELLPALHDVAQANLANFRDPEQQCFALESICADATTWDFPPEPTVLYLFNPFPQPGLVDVIKNLQSSLEHAPRPVRVLYHNPLLAEAFAHAPSLRKVASGRSYSLYASED
jgi:SAM-dependent methyltransferase